MDILHHKVVVHATKQWQKEGGDVKNIPVKPF